MKIQSGLAMVGMCAFLFAGSAGLRAADDTKERMAAAAKLTAEAKQARQQHEREAKQIGAEPARVKYVKALTALIYEYYDANYTYGTWKGLDTGFDAVRAELGHYPAPASVDYGKVAKLRVGRWQSPRHDYLYRANGTWTMLPEEKDGTHGKWSIRGNHYSDGAGDETHVYTIILLDEDYFVFMDKDGTVFWEQREVPRP